jgi:2'-deoxynucleoside 5'-phosphate N-hydrolase
MRIYLAAAMTNPARDPDVLGRLLEHIEGSGHSVPTRHIVQADARQRDASITDAELARRDLDWVSSCDALVAEVSTPSHGVGVEVMTALGGSVPVLLLRREGVPVSRLLTGLPGVRSATYQAIAEACAAIDAFLATARP